MGKEKDRTHKTDAPMNPPSLPSQLQAAACSPLNR